MMRTFRQRVRVYLLTAGILLVLSEFFVWRQPISQLAMWIRQHPEPWLSH